MGRFALLILSVCFHFVNAQDTRFEEIRHYTFSGQLEAAEHLAKTTYDSAGVRDIDRAYAAYWLGNIYQEMQKYSASSQFYSEALTVSELMDHDTLRLKVLTSWGILAAKTGYHETAITRISQVLDLAADLKDTTIIRAAYEHLGNTYFIHGDADAALNEYLNSLKYAQLLGDSALIAAGKNNVGTVLMNQEKYDEALDYFEETLDLYQKTGQMNRMTEVYSNMHYIYSVQRSNMTKWIIGACSVMILIIVAAVVIIYRLTSRRIVIAETVDLSRINVLLAKRENLALTYLYLAKGIPQKEISELLHVTPSAISKYVTEIKELLGVEDILEDSKKFGYSIVPAKDIIQHIHSRR